MKKAAFTISALHRIHQHWDETGEKYLVELHAEVQREGDPGGEAFRVIVASPSKLVMELEGRTEVESGRGYLFLNDYDEHTILVWLQRLIEVCGASTWEDLQGCIERYFDWIE